MIETRPYPQHYIRHANSANRAASVLVARDVFTPSDLSVSIGLSLHSMELSGKAILRAFNTPHEDIKRRHNRHDLLLLLREAEQMAKDDRRTKDLCFSSFLSHKPQSISWKPFLDVEAALIGMLEDEIPMSMRDYLYPDNKSFRHIEPYGVLPRMALYLAKSAMEISKALGWFNDELES